VQFEVYRGLSMGLWTATHALARVEKLVGSAQTIGPDVFALLLDRADRKGKGGVHPNILCASFLSGCRLGTVLTSGFFSFPFFSAEYDREHAAMLEKGGRGLGLMGTWHGVENWYGGRIQQILRRESKGGKVLYVLQEPEMKRSHRVARFVASRRVLEIRIPKAERFAVEPHMLARKFVLAGRVFVPFAAKDGKLYAVETREDWQRAPDAEQGDATRISFKQFVQWHNSLSRNFKQAASKWVTRFDLGLSTSVPACEFKPENIAYIEDKCAFSGFLRDLHV
jgi:hypothetical protein